MRPLRLGLALLLLGAGCVGDGGAPSGDHARGGEGEGEGEPGGPGEVAGEGEPPCPEGDRKSVV